MLNCRIQCYDLRLLTELIVSNGFIFSNCIGFCVYSNVFFAVAGRSERVTESKAKHLNAFQYMIYSEDICDRSKIDVMCQITTLKSNIDFHK